jgi:hypothetical protein
MVTRAGGGKSTRLAAGSDAPRRRIGGEQQRGFGVRERVEGSANCPGCKSSKIPAVVNRNGSELSTRAQNAERNGGWEVLGRSGRFKYLWPDSPARVSFKLFCDGMSVYLTAMGKFKLADRSRSEGSPQEPTKGASTGPSPDLIVRGSLERNGAQWTLEWTSNDRGLGCSVKGRREWVPPGGSHQIAVPPRPRPESGGKSSS